MQNSPSTSTIAFSYLARSLAALDTPSPSQKSKRPPRMVRDGTCSPNCANRFGQSVVCVGMATTLGEACLSVSSGAGGRPRWCLSPREGSLCGLVLLGFSARWGEADVNQIGTAQPSPGRDGVGGRGVDLPARVMRLHEPHDPIPARVKRIPERRGFVR